MSADSPDVGPHHNHAAEQIVLGSCLLDPNIITSLVAIIAPDTWHNPHHIPIWAAILDHYTNGKPGDPAAIAQTLATQGTLAKLPNGYLHTLIETVPTTSNATWYAQQLADKTTLRRLHEAATRIGHITANPNGTPISNVATQVSQIMFDAVQIGTDSDTLHVLGELIDPTLAAIETAGTGANPALPTGYADLDKLLNGGLRPGQLVIVAGRPGHGKTTAVLGAATHAAIHDHKTVLFFTLEMTGQELMNRILSDQCRIPYSQILTGQLDDNEWSTLARRAGDIAAATLYVEEDPNCTLPAIRAKARQLNAHTPLSLIVVDYLQLMTPAKRAENRQQEVAEMSRGLKLLAKELAVPIVVAAQLNRNVESRTDKTPQLSDLRESGSIENDADIVILVHRDECYNKNSTRIGEADFIVAKHRAGMTGVIPVSAQLHYVKFADLFVA